MRITEIRIKLVDEDRLAGNERLHAFASITFEDQFVVRDLKVIDGQRGLFVAMPSRKLMDRCPRCRMKNPLRNRFCGNCGTPLDPDRALRDPEGRAKLHVDIAHPINAGCRSIVQERVLHEYVAERERAKQPGHVSSYDRPWGESDD